MVLKPVKLSDEKKRKIMAQRHEFLVRACYFAIEIAAERGMPIDTQNKGDHTRIIHDLGDFGGFRIRTDIPYAIDGPELDKAPAKIFGGAPKSVEISMQPKGGEPKMLLSATWVTDLSSCMSVQVDNDERWQKEFLAVIKRRKAISEQMDREYRQMEAKKRQQEEDERRRQAQIEQAKRLGLDVTGW